MPYTNETLAEYMAVTLGETGAALGLTEASDIIVEGVNQAVLDYEGIADASGASDDRKIRMLAKAQAWYAAMATVAGDYNFSDAGARFDRGQMFEHCKTMWQMAVWDALLYSPDYKAEFSEVAYPNDPYKFHEPGEYLRMRE